VEIAAANPRLMAGLAVTAVIDTKSGGIQTNPAVLPRIYAPEAVQTVRTRDEAAARLASLDPAREAVVEGAVPGGSNGGAQVRITAYERDLYRARVETPHPSLLRIAVPYFPGWKARVDGKPAAVVPVDLALMGVTVPAGRHELVLSYASSRFATGLTISVLAWFGGIAALVKWRPD
jgi:hypothetical protein